MVGALETSAPPKNYMVGALETNAPPKTTRLVHLRQVHPLKLL